MATSKRERQKAGRREKLERQQRHLKRRKNLRRSLIVAVIAILVFGTGALLFVGKPTTTTTTTIATASPQAQANAKAVAAGCPASTSTRVNTLTWTKAPAMTITTAKTYYANFATTAGNFVVKLDAKTAPITTNNFVFLAQHQYYKCVIFHRAIPGFMIQGGDPTGTGSGGPGYTIADELPKAGSPTYPLYSIAMANTNAPHTGGGQFFIVTGTAGETLPATYSLFGQVVSGTKVVNIIQNAGNPSKTANGVPPIVTHRILNITISEK
jgi:cyclophilin family peptidyl-prolyl cis-trans isomerase